MKDIVHIIEKLRILLDKHRKDMLKELPTRTIFIDPLLEALGWDVRNPDEVQLEYPTIDGKSVDYATKLNRKPVLFIEAKPLNDPLTDVKAITQIISYAVNDNVDWCILTNGVIYKVFRSSEKADAPNKLLYEISIDSKDSGDKSLQEIAKQFLRFSQDAMAKGILDEIGEQIFTTAKVRKALDKLFIEPPRSFVNTVRSLVADETIKPQQIKDALKRLWTQTSEVQISESKSEKFEVAEAAQPLYKAGKYTEEHHLKGKPVEVVELYRTLDKYCRELALKSVKKQYLAKYISYKIGKAIFCTVHLHKNGLKIWLKLDYSDVNNPPDFVRDVTNIGHWGVGNLEVRIDSFDKFQYAKQLIKISLEANK